MQTPAAFEYERATSVDGAIASLERLGSEARVIAGGHSLLPMMKLRLANPEHLIDINDLTELSYIREQDGEIRIGAMTRHFDLLRSDVLAEHFPLFRDAETVIADPVVRNRGTIGGSLCHLDPSAELLNMAALHDGVLEAASRSGRREIRIADWVSGIMTNALEPGELLTGVTLNSWPTGHGYAFEEFARRHGDFAITAVSCLLTLDRNGTIGRAALCVSGLGPAPVRVVEAERLLVGARRGHDVFRAAAIAAQALEAMSDAYVTAAYRKHLARVLTYRALERASARAGGQG